MKARLVRTAASLAVVVAAYCVYALTVVPLVEPWAPTQGIEKSPTEPSKTATRDPDERLRRQWGKYFVADAWELHGAKVLESEQAVFFVGDYHNLPDGRVELRPFTMLSIPRDQRAADGSIKPGGKVIALNAPEGAILKFDEPFDMKKAKIGKLEGADMMGPVHIHNAPPQPGAADDLDIKTRDVKLVDDQIVTPKKVDFRFGPNVGTGRDLKIVLAKDEKDDAKKNGANFSGMQSLELKHDVKMRVMLGGKGLMPGAPAGKPGVAKDGATPQASGNPQTASGPTAPGNPKTAGGAPAAAGQAKPGGPPVEVTCQGPFQFDVVKSVATFTDQVDVLRINPVGPSDTMNCELLVIYFAPKEAAKPQPGKPAAEAKPTDKNSLSKLEARMIEARGEPVIVRSPSNGGNVRCQRLEYDLRNGTIRLEGEREVLLNQGTNEIRTRKLDFQPAAVGRLGRLTASGPGTLHGAMAEDPTRKYSARWGKQLLMQPEGDLHRITLLGKAQMRLNDTGTLDAEEIFIWVSEPPPTGAANSGTKPAAPRAAAPLPGAAPAAGPSGLAQTGGAGGIQVERLLAVDKVRIDSSQLTGATNRLEVWFNRPKPPGPAIAAAAPSVAPATPAAAPVAAAPAKPAAKGPLGGPANPLQRFDVAGALLRLLIAAPPDAPMAVSEVTVEGNARLVETKTAKFTDKPLLVRGQTLHVERADTPNAHITVIGKPAYVEARGMTLSGATIQMLKGDNRLWVDGAGRMTLPTKGQLTAAPRPGAPQPPPPAANGRGAAPTPPLEITWQRGMNFDGLTAIYEHNVLAQTEHQWLRTEYLAVSLKRRIDFGSPPPSEGGGEANSEVHQVDCRGGVLLEARDFDERGLTAVDQMQLMTLMVNQTTGAIDGHGPGWVNRVSRGEPAAGANGQKANVNKPVAVEGASGVKPATAAKDARLTYLHVTFENGMTGNINRREVTFTDQVRTVYGPILNWQEKLNADNMSSLGPEGIVMNCQLMTVREMPSAIRGEKGTMELEAIGNTLVEGRTFTAHAHRLTYAQAKDLLVFEGDGRSDAELYRQVAVGLPMTKAAARKIMYWRTANRAEVDDARHLDLGNIPGGPAGKTPTKTATGFLVPVGGMAP